MPHSRPRPWPIWRSVLGAERKHEEAWPTVAVWPDFGREPALARQEPLPAARGKRPVGKGPWEKDCGHGKRQQLRRAQEGLFGIISVHIGRHPPRNLPHLGKQMDHAALPFALEIRSLAKHFERPAVDGLDLTVRAGEFYTLLGPNGAGKTTTLRMVTGLLEPDRGSITVFGIDALADPVGAKQIIAWLSDEPMIDASGISPIRRR